MEETLMISPHAIIHPGAVIADDVSIGPFSIIGDEVKIGPGTVIGSHAVVEGPTVIGCRNRISHHVVIGTPPQDLKYKGEKTRLEMGDDNLVREFATIHRGTQDGGGLTQVKNRCMIMAYAHIAHDCHIGNEVILANAVNMAGHVTIEDYVIVGGMCAIHQFVRIGKYAFIGGLTPVAQDVVPYGLVAGSRGELKGINSVGLKRRGFDTERRKALHKAVRLIISGEMNLSHLMDMLKKDYPENPDIEAFVQFVRTSERGICVR
jgi:UDP-N-acetylglucosamine acyltransferase